MSDFTIGPTVSADQLSTIEPVDALELLTAVHDEIGRSGGRDAERPQPIAAQRAEAEHRLVALFERRDRERAAVESRYTPMLRIVQARVRWLLVEEAREEARIARDGDKAPAASRTGEVRS